MDTEKTLQDLLDLLGQLSIEVKYHRGNFRGGLVYYNGNKYFYLNRKDDAKTQISLIVSELKQNDIEPEQLAGIMNGAEELQE